jgi:hypothetical protein
VDGRGGMSAERAEYAADQARLLRSLVAGADYPDGFSEVKAAAASAALRRKRRRAVAKALPALALEPDFDERFIAFAGTVAAPAVGGGLADGLAFARTVERRRLSEDARVELLLAGARLGPRVGAVVLRDPPGLLVAGRLPGGRVRALRLGPR